MHSGSGRGCAKGRGRKHSTYPELGKSCWCSARRSGAAGTQQRSTSLRTARSASRRVLWVRATLVGSPVCRVAQLAVASTALGRSWPAVPAPAPGDGPALDRVLDLAADEAPSRLPLRP